ncbi:MAG: hypothetical protein QM500_01995 [Methylococcales bacterium]
MIYFDKNLHEKILSSSISRLPSSTQQKGITEKISFITGFLILGLITTYFIKAPMIIGTLILSALYIAGLIWLGYRLYVFLFFEKAKLYFPSIQGNSNLIREIAISKEYKVDNFDRAFLISLSKKKPNQITLDDLYRFRFILNILKREIGRKMQVHTNELMHKARTSTRNNSHSRNPLKLIKV